MAKDHLNNPWDSDSAREAQKKSVEARKRNRESVDDMLIEAGYENPDEAPATIRRLAISASKGSAADMRLFLQQTNQLKGKEQGEWDGQGLCPLCGADPSGGLVIHAETLEQLDRAREILKRLLEEE